MKTIIRHYVFVYIPECFGPIFVGQLTHGEYEEYLALFDLTDDKVYCSDDSFSLSSENGWCMSIYEGWKFKFAEKEING